MHGNCSESTTKHHEDGHHGLLGRATDYILSQPSLTHPQGLRRTGWARMCPPRLRSLSTPSTHPNYHLNTTHLPSLQGGREARLRVLQWLNPSTSPSPSRALKGAPKYPPRSHGRLPCACLLSGNPTYVGGANPRTVGFYGFSHHIL